MDDKPNKYAMALATLVAAIMVAIMLILLVWGLHSVWTGFVHSLS